MNPILKPKSILIFFSTLFGLTQLGHSKIKLQLGQATFGGKGCRGQGELQKGPGENIYKVVLENFKVDLSQVKGRSLIRIQCSIALPFKGEKGKKGQFIWNKIKGTKSIDSKATGRFQGELFLTGSKGKVLIQNFKGEEKGSWEISSFPSKISSPCGKDGILRLNLSFLIRSKKRKGVSFLDLSNGKTENELSFKVKEENCH